MNDNWIKDLKNVIPKGNYSQYGEEAFIDFIFKNIGVKSKHFVDIGANDGVWFSNTRNLINLGWKGLMIDGGHENELVKKHFVTKENIIDLLDLYNTPIEFDLLSLDIDGNDYWVLQEILSKYKPRVIISEYNAELPIGESKTIEYDPKFTFKSDIYYGYTFEAGKKLAEANGYKIIHQHGALNLFYIRLDELNEPSKEIYVKHEQHDWWKNKTNKKWINI